MHVGRTTLLLLSAACLAWGANGQAPSTAPATTPEAPTNEQACRAAVVRFMDAMDHGAADALDRSIYCDPSKRAQADGLEALKACATAQHDFETAVGERWGQAAAQAIAGETRFTPAERAAVAQAERSSSAVGTAALLRTSRNAAPILLRRNSAGAPWLVVVSAITSLYDGSNRRPEPGSQRRIDDMRTVAATLAAVTAQVRGGSFDSADAASRALQAAMVRAAAATGGDE